MSEETLSFKFKKREVKKIGDFDVLDTSEWTLLTKPQQHDVTLFVHFRKLWNVQETPEVLDADGNVTEEAVKIMPAFEIKAGFVKDEKFIVTATRPFSNQNYHEIHKRYLEVLNNYVNSGYVKDYNNYMGDVAIIPGYYVNERTPMIASIANVGQIVNSVMPSSNPQTAFAQAKAAVTGAKAQNKFSFLRSKITGKTTNPTNP